MPPNSDSLLRHSATTEVEHLTDMGAFEEALRDRICHWYPKKPGYRVSGSSVPQVGDIAYCGHIKTFPYSGGIAATSWPQCQSCMRLRRIDGHA